PSSLFHFPPACRSKARFSRVLPETVQVGGPDGAEISRRTRPASLSALAARASALAASGAARGSGLPGSILDRGIARWSRDRRSSCCPRGGGHVQAGRRARVTLVSSRRDTDGVLELGRQRSILGHCGPAVGQDLHLPAAS